MYNLLKPLLKVVGYVPPEKETKVKTRVIAYGQFYYIAQYYKGWSWHNFIDPFMAGNQFPELWSINQPHLSDNFNELVEFCKKFKTYKEIETWEQKLKDNFNNQYFKCLENRQMFKNKIWQSE